MEWLAHVVIGAAEPVPLIAPAFGLAGVLLGGLITGVFAYLLVSDHRNLTSAITEK